jgi:3-oxoacyl-(acyl-carrier-protein) synthase
MSQKLTRFLANHSVQQQAAIIAAREAWADAGVETYDRERTGIVLGSAIGGVIGIVEQAVQS